MPDYDYDRDLLHEIELLGSLIEAAAQVDRPLAGDLVDLTLGLVGTKGAPQASAGTGDHPPG